MQHFDTVVIGAGAAGLFCAGIAGQLGLSVLVVDHAAKVAEKIRISGGGRCNFTNRELDPRAPHRHFLGENPQFCRSALSRYTAQDFIALVQRHGIPFHEKHKGQLFGDRSSEDFIRMLLAECEAGGVTRWQPCAVREVGGVEGPGPARFRVATDRGEVTARHVVVATGGLSIPQIGATDFGWRLARQFGLPVVEPRPALVPLTFDGEGWKPYAQLAGLALPVRIATGTKKARTVFDEDLLFTHRGLSGPAVLQISSYWAPGQPIRMDLVPGVEVAQALADAKAAGARKQVANLLAQWMPTRLADAWAGRDPGLQRPVVECADKALSALAGTLADWEITPTGTEGWRKAEVTAGGVATSALSQQTLESRVAGLYFIGETVDITGWLGGYNFQWAWSSGYACAQAMAA
ncbi:MULTISPECIES: NAD(P)/FAD-dependent oxidoreductase [Ramlibacter]|uniref:NAD(P)/FAD-dependent oxidoreductase n=1 Tax=Ramlibacter aquaticus TaxID=2780094 RepID=A0ABR9S9H8_9BURK|nr:MULTISPECIES: NAD(P)/FAD-dependent oxidoreductase [Ramlibacter]MBE7938960.1 NAD(P)/FAD-dependent oxidoreductase [Ramlibacter aquaticus]